MSQCQLVELLTNVGLQQQLASSEELWNDRRERKGKREWGGGGGGDRMREKEMKRMLIMTVKSTVRV